MKKTTLCAIGILTILNTYAQTSQPKHLNFGMALGVISPLGVSNDIYVDNSNCFVSRFIVEGEKGIGKKGALQSGLQFSTTTIAMDAVINPGNKLATAPDSIKYPSLSQYSLQIPLRYRFYKQESKNGKFYQLGATVGYTFNNTYRYRLAGAEKEKDITDVNPVQVLVHAGLGRRFNTKHVFYFDWSINVTRYFKQQDADNIYPLQLCFGLLL